VNYVPIAEVTFFTNVPAGHYPTDDDAAVVSADIAEQFEALIAARGLAEELAVVRVEYRLGCILTTLTIGAVIGATGAAAVGFAKTYPKLRQSLILLLRDIHGLYTHLRDPDKRVTSWLYNDDVFKEAKIRDATPLIAQSKTPRRRDAPPAAPKTRH